MLSWEKRVKNQCSSFSGLEVVEKLAKEKEEVREKLEETCSGNLQLDQMLPGDSGEYESRLLHLATWLLLVTLIVQWWGQEAKLE